MKLYLRNHDYKYAAEQILLTMFPHERPEYPEKAEDGDRAELTLHRGERVTSATCRLVRNGASYTGISRISASRITDKLSEDRLLQKIVKLAFYRAALKSGCAKPVWGAHTGIRPGKIISGYLESGMTDAQALSRFKREYDVSTERGELCLDTAKAGLQIAGELERRDICLYVGIPFCPTRCAYCSFVSQSVERSMDLIEPFLEALFLEIAETAKVIADTGLRVVSVYIGGGTPTTLSAAQLDRLCGHLSASFDFSALREFTVEAGRPDTITPEKLETLCAHNVTRISVNPQTMRDGVLSAIGRRHTAADVIRAMEAVRAYPSLSINMDLIAGLPGDSAEGFSESLDTVLSMRPENITVHTLSLKKGSRIMLEKTPLPPENDVGVMVDSARERLKAEEYLPYYLYRQKYIAGGFENVGFSKKDFINVYNICIMEELCSIISLGGGASTKLVTGTGRIERMFNPKYPAEYISKIQKLINEKDRIKEFYDGLRYI